MMNRGKIEFLFGKAEAIVLVILVCVGLIDS